VISHFHPQTTFDREGSVAQQIRRFGVAQTAKVIGVLYALMGVILIPVFLVIAMFSPNEQGFGSGFALALPIIYGVMGFVLTAIGCLVYNLVAGWVGGVEVELEGPSTGY
jgi:hypothetical protein